MAPLLSRRSTRRFASLAALAAVAITTSLGVRRERAEACGGFELSIADMTTFDPDVAEDWGGLSYDPFTAGFGGACEDCGPKAMVADWHGFLKDAVTAEDWSQVLLKASLADIFAIEKRLAGKTTTGPKGFETSSLWKDPAAAKQLGAAVEFVELLKRIEPFTTFEMYGTPAPRPPDPMAKELAAAQRGLKAAKEPFLQQRYAFAILRILFYRREWPAAVAFFDKTLATLSAPSEDLKWRARYYVAGALRKDGRIARANLELARIHAGYTPLAGAAVGDFKPSEEADWKEALRLAKDTRDKTALWRMVGLAKDELPAIQEIQKLDPKSNLLALLVVRELGDVESMVGRTFNAAPDPKDVAAQRKAYARLEQLALKIAATPGADRPWLMTLVAAHIAAKRGDLATTRTRIQQVLAARPSDRRIASQAKASLAIAMVADWKLNPQNEQELASLIRDVAPEFSRMGSLRNEVRTKLALAYAAAGKLVDAEFLAAGAGDPFEDGNTLEAKLKPRWTQVAFLKEMIARADQRTTEFDRFVLKDSHVKAKLEQDLALRYVLDGDFAAAVKTFETTSATSELLHTDPFVIHILDCHDCDHDKFGATAKWTHKNLAARLGELEVVAKGGGEKGAEAALALGNALYNITWYGNARSFLESSHQPLTDAHAAERWYKRAYELTKNRELKVKAAFLAAKAELGNELTRLEEADPARTDYTAIETAVPKTWFPIVKRFSDTRYYKEVLAECGRFRSWLVP